MKSFIFTAALIIAQTVSADPHHIRFWKGYKQDKVAYQDFVNSITRGLIPMTVEVGSGKGLKAYLPVVLPEKKPEYLPDEIAILTYESLPIYQELTRTPEWKAYGPLHYAEGNFISKNGLGYSSGSTVVQEYSDQLVFEDKVLAVKLGSVDGDFQPYENSIAFYSFKSELNKNDCLKSFIKSQKGYVGLVVLYDVKYVAVLKAHEISEPSALKKHECLNRVYSDRYVKDTRIENRANSVNFQF